MATTAILSRHSATQIGAPAFAADGPHLRRPVASTAGTPASLDSFGTSVAYARGKTLIEEGAPADNVYKVVSGALRKVRLLPDGRRHITSFLMPGDFFGFAEAPGYSHTVEAVADAVVLRYPRRTFEAILDRDPRAGRHLLALVCRALFATQDQLLLLGRKSALERMSAFLLALADQNGADRNGSGRNRAELDLPMNRGDVADYLGLTVETVSRLITRLRSLGIIDAPDAHRIVILKRAALEDLSAGHGGEA